MNLELTAVSFAVTTMIGLQNPVSLCFLPYPMCSLNCRPYSFESYIPKAGYVQKPRSEELTGNALSGETRQERPWLMSPVMMYVKKQTLWA